MGGGGGGIKGHQDTVVHPMYVSYNSLPTTASGSLMRRPNHNHTASSLLKAKRSVGVVHAGGGGGTVPGSRSGLDCHQNFVNFNGRDNLLRSAIENGEQLNSYKFNGEMHDTPNYYPPPTPLFGVTAGSGGGAKNHIPKMSDEVTKNRFQEAILQRRIQQRKSMVDGESFYTGSEPVDDLIDLQPIEGRQQTMQMSQVHGRKNNNMFGGDVVEEELPEYNSFNRANILVNQRLKDGGFYKYPVDFIPRSPNLSGKRKRSQHSLKNMNFCDQIRSPPVPNQQQQQRATVKELPSRAQSHTQLQSSASSHSGGFNNYHNYNVDTTGIQIGEMDGNSGHGEVDALPDKFAVNRLPGLGEWEYVNVPPQNVVQRRRGGEDQWTTGLGEGGHIQNKMNEMLMKKKSLRPRSYCSSNYYNHDVSANVQASQHAPSYN